MGDIEAGYAVPRSAVSVTVRLRGHQLVQDKPASLGGDDQGPMASELLLASLLACQSSTFVKVAAKRRIDARATRIDGALHFDDKGDIAKATVDWTLEGDIDATQADTLVRLTDRACTVSRALSIEIVSAHNLSSAGEPASDASRA